MDGGTRWSRRGFLGAGVVALAGCTTQRRGPGGNDGGPTGNDRLSGNVAIAGSSTVYPVAEAVAREFQQVHPDATVTVQRTGSGAGFRNFFCVGKTDFNNASRPIADDETELCAGNGVGWHEIAVATDALTVVVNNDNDWVDCLTVEQLRRIWEPEPAERWSDVDPGWPDEPIDRYGPAETSGTFDYFTEAVVGEEGAHTQDYSPTERDNDIVQGVRGSRFAIGYFGFSFYYNNPDLVKALAIDDGDGCVEPSLGTAKSGAYTPLARPLFTYVSTTSLQRPTVAEFARFYAIMSADESLIADQVGYVPNTEERMHEELGALEIAIREARS